VGTDIVGKRVQKHIGVCWSEGTFELMTRNEVHEILLKLEMLKLCPQPMYIWHDIENIPKTDICTIAML
jgi:hypothetical protein